MEASEGESTLSYCRSGLGLCELFGNDGSALSIVTQGNLSSSQIAFSGANGAGSSSDAIVTSIVSESLLSSINKCVPQHAIDLMPISKDIYDGALVLEGLAQVYAWSGDRDRAIGLVQKLVTMPGYTNYGRLKLHPLWSPLRGDSQFEKIVNSLAPK